VTGKSPVDALREGSPVIRWLMTEGRHITDAKSFLECFAARLRDARVDVSRITTGVPVSAPAALLREFSLGTRQGRHRTGATAWIRAKTPFWPTARSEARMTAIRFEAV